MNDKSFNPSQWLDNSQPRQDSSNPNPVSTNIVNPSNNPLQEHEVSTPCQSVEMSNPDTQLQDIEEIVSRIESSSIDIAPNYPDWRDLGFAISDAMGENGRSYYHRISRFYPNYSATETDKQYNACLNSHGHGITIKTLFHLAKQAGISVSIPNTVSTNPIISTPKKSSQNSPISPNPPSGDLGDLEDIPELTELPTFSNIVKDDLPLMLSQTIDNAQSDADADMLLLGAVTVFSCCMPNVYGIYGNREVYPNLYLFVVAPAASGKGNLALCRNLVQPIHDKLRDLSREQFREYNRLKSEYYANKRRGEPPVEPPLQTLIIPANSSSTAVYQTLNENDGIGLMFETEGDTLAVNFKSDYGNYSDGFRKAFHHEPITYARRKDKEFVEIVKPKLSALLSGTPQQVLSLMPTPENGLFSRFMFYFLLKDCEWIDTFATTETSLDENFLSIGNTFVTHYETLTSMDAIRFSLSVQQQKSFTQFFTKLKGKYIDEYGGTFSATIPRSGLIAFRIAMVLSVLRAMESGNLSAKIQCIDTDYKTAIAIIEVLMEHSARIFKTFPSAKPFAIQDMIPLKQKFFNELPVQFPRKKALLIAASLDIPPKTADKHLDWFISKGKLCRTSHGHFQKTPPNTSVHS